MRLSRSSQFQVLGLVLVLGGFLLSCVLWVLIALAVITIQNRYLGYALIAIFFLWILVVVALGSLLYGRRYLLARYIRSIVKSGGSRRVVPERLEVRTGADLQDIPDDFLKKGTEPNVLFVSSNGAGLGHLTRLMAIARRLKCNTSFFSFSKGYRAVSQLGWKITYFPSYDKERISRSLWGSRLTAAFRSCLITSQADAVVFDGTHVYPELTEICRYHGIPLVWSQRGLWKAESFRRSWQRHDPQLVCDHLLIPGDYAGEDLHGYPDRPFQKKYNPVIFFDLDECLSSIDARIALELPEGPKYILIQLGAGTINQTDEFERVVVESVRVISPNWVPVLVRSELSSSNRAPEGALLRRCYPMGRYYNAFDAAVVAGGYNSVQEVVSYCLPALIIPNLYTKTDDQELRAKRLVDAGLILSTTASHELFDKLSLLVSDDVRIAMRERMANVKKENGAHAMAEDIYRIALSSKEWWPIISEPSSASSG